MITVDTIGIIAKAPNALKADLFGTETRWLWVRFQSGTGSGPLYLNVVTTGETAVAAGELAKDARVRVRGALGSRRFGRGEDARFVTVVDADEVTVEPAAEEATPQATRKDGGKLRS
jgi:hypothetical protein